jgi:hypothetical protein
VQNTLALTLLATLAALALSALTTLLAALAKYCNGTCGKVQRNTALRPALPLRTRKSGDSFGPRSPAPATTPGGVFVSPLWNAGGSRR